MSAAVVAFSALRRRVAIERPDDVADEAGGVTRGFAPLATVFARVEPVSAEETCRGAALGLAKLWRVVIRARGDVAGGCRAAWSGRAFTVLSVRCLDADGRFEELLCEELTP
ncbi:phage head closure protein [Methylopila musalis]|uniref:Phage head closure protein n=1 Tax=Methylopila musalis TaxID=1134781 RepID=A0ABW3ZD04_9HYPH